MILSSPLTKSLPPDSLELWPEVGDEAAADLTLGAISNIVRVIGEEKRAMGEQKIEGKLNLNPR